VPAIRHRFTDVSRRLRADDRQLVAAVPLVAALFRVDVRFLGARFEAVADAFRGAAFFFTDFAAAPDFFAVGLFRPVDRSGAAGWVVSSTVAPPAPALTDAMAF
jgi:hypothetical protein